jgi:hypothetical protein
MNPGRSIMPHAIAKTTAAIAVGVALLAVVSAAAGASERPSHDVIECSDHGEAGHADSLLDWVVFQMKQSSQDPDTPIGIEMANRQAKRFAMFLVDTNPAAFAAMMRATLDGQPFGEAVEAGYRTDLDALWQRFVQADGK